MTGDQGEVTPSFVSVTKVTRTSRTASTDIGRAFQLFSPVPNRNGSPNKSPMPTTGATRMSAVSIHGGSSAKAANSDRKKKSGRGTVRMSVGSGTPLGPIGPKIAAQATTERIVIPAKTRSRWAASGKNGTPSSWTRRS